MGFLELELKAHSGSLRKNKERSRVGGARPTAKLNDAQNRSHHETIVFRKREMHVGPL